MWGTWHDEGLNSELKKIAAHAHRLVWAARCLSNFDFMQGIEKGANMKKQ